MNRLHGSLFVLLVSATLLPGVSPAQSIDTGAAPVSAPTPAFNPNVLPTLNVRPTATPIVVDGLIQEPAWNHAAKAVNFSEVFPGDQSKPPIGIVAYMTYDSDNLYVAFRIEDDPDHVRANLSDRDALWQDDYVGVILDPNQDGQSLYFIASNPLGVQGDSRIAVNNEDEGFNLIYSAEAAITDTGYEVEMAIPFKSLRFPNKDVQLWRGTFWVTHPRASRSQYSWAAMDRDNPCWSCQLGTISGVQGVRAGRNLEILPALTSASAGALVDPADPASGFDNNRIAVEPSLNVKYGITSSLTADVALNPDFSQIEADVARIDVNSTFALFYDERRPFFQEGSDLFRTEIQTVYTRSINDPIVASKLTGRFGSTDLAYIGARDDTSPLLMPFEEESRLISVGRSVSNILRVKYNLPGNSYVGTLVTDRRLDIGGAERTIGLDGQLRFLKKYLLSGQVVASHTAEPIDEDRSQNLAGITFGSKDYTAALDGERFGGHAATFELDREGRYYGFEAGYEQSTPTFRAANGFVRQNSMRRFYLWQGVTLYPESIVPFFDRIRPNLVFGRRWNYDGLHKSDFLSPRLGFQMKGQTNLSMRYVWEREHFAGELFEGIRQFSIDAGSNFSEYASIFGEISTGRDIARFLDAPTLGGSLDVAASVSLRPNQHLAVQSLVAYSRLKSITSGENYFSGYIARVRVKYQFTRRFFFRTVVQYNDFSSRFDIDTILTYKLNAFSAVHLGSTHDLDEFAQFDDAASKYFRQSSRQVFFKFQYLVRK